METKNLSFEKMECIIGGQLQRAVISQVPIEARLSPCQWAIGLAIFSAICVGGATFIAPSIWVSPKTWFAAGTLIAGNAANIHESCY
jgi:hypothetical protein